MVRSLLSWLQLPLCAGAIFLVAHQAHAQSGWTQKKGNYYLKLYSTYGRSDEYFNLAGNKIMTSEFTQSISGFYGEYGLTDRLTLISHGPVLKHQYFETTEKITAVGDLPLGLKYSLGRGAFPVAADIIMDIPLAKADNYAQNKINTFERINLPAGDGEWNFKMTVAASHSFYPAPVYVSAYGMFNYRTSYKGADFSNQLSSGIEAGVNLCKKVWVMGKLSFQKSLGHATVVDFVRGEGTEFTALQVSSSISISPRTGLSLAYFNYTDFIVHRANLYSGGVVSFGISYELKH